MVALLEHLIALSPNVRRVESRQHRSRCQLDISDLKPRVRNKDEHLDREGFRNEYVCDSDEREREEQG